MTISVYRSRLELQERLRELVTAAITTTHFTGDGTRVMLPLADLIALGCATAEDQAAIAEWLRAFAERNP